MGDGHSWSNKLETKVLTTFIAVALRRMPEILTMREQANGEELTGFMQELYNKATIIYPDTAFTERGFYDLIILYAFAGMNLPSFDVSLIEKPFNFMLSYSIYKLIRENRGNPMIYIGKPGNYLYIFDREIISLKMPVILGRITIVADAYDEDGISKVEFYIDDNLKSTDYDKPYSWLWDEKAIGRYEIKVVAYDNGENVAEDKINVIIFNLGG